MKPAGVPPNWVTVVAWSALAVAFQYFAIAPMRGLGFRGFFTEWPANVWLIKRGIKQAM